MIMTVQLRVQEYVVADKTTADEPILKVKQHPCLEIMITHVTMHGLASHGDLMQALSMILKPYGAVVHRHRMDITFEFESQEGLTSFVLAWS